MGRLSGTVALITGAARGIGAGCARVLAADGADIAINDRDHFDLAEQVAAEIKDMGRRARVYPADVGDRSAVETMIETVCRDFGRLDIAIANAGKSVRQPITEITPEGLDTTLGPTMFGVLYTIQFAARAMIRQGPLPGRESGGKIIVISSIHSEFPVPRSGSYNLAKAGVVHLAQTAAAELAPHRINVNVIAPGWIDTPGERDHATEEELQAAGPRLPWGRLGQPEEIGKLAAFLASPDADYISGAYIRADGAEMVSLQAP